MANFTLNSLSTQNLIGSDNLMKSNSDGALSKASVKSFKDYITGGSVNVDYADFYNAHQTTGAAYVSLPSVAPTTVVGITPQEVFSGTVTIPTSGLYEITAFVGLGVASGGGNATCQVLVDGSLVASPSTNTGTIQVMDQTFASLSAGSHTVSLRVFGSFADSNVVYSPYIKSKINFKYC